VLKLTVVEGIIKIANLRMKRGKGVGFGYVLVGMYTYVHIHRSRYAQRNSGNSATCWGVSILSTQYLPPCSFPRRI
jgi:hypothetical protein